MRYNVPGELDLEVMDGKVRFSIDGVSTNWMEKDDLFIKRIDEESLNHEFLEKHLKKEIRIRNVLDEGVLFFKAGKYPKAITRLDDVLFYDPEYGQALMCKSCCLQAQRHFVKALRYYRRAVRADASLDDVEYHKALSRQANDERSNFPKLKRNIYAGDEHFAKGEFESAIESYGRALKDPSGFKEKILSKLLNKKATAHMKLEDYEEALACFEESLVAGANDYAIFGRGICEYNLNLEVNDGFRRCLRISKPQMLEQAIVLRDLGHIEESSRISGFLRENHFRKDELYEKLALLID